MVLNAVGPVHAVKVWTPQTCCPSCCQNVITWEPQSAKREKINTVEVSEGKCATVDFGKHFSPLPKKRIFNGNADRKQLHSPLL